jgi:beta-glucosidase-like glycosyl hydrolase/CubicO group peptidase (beta-lactamase class C family)
MKYKITVSLIVIFIISAIKSVTAQEAATPVLASDSAAAAKKQWVDSVYNAMTVEQRIGQLFMLRAHSNKSREYHNKVKAEIERFRVGGVCFFQGGPLRQINLVNEYQKVSKVPMFVAIDGEWGVGMRLDSVVDFPRQMTLGATGDDSLIYEIGVEIGRQCRAVGVNIDFAPVADVNCNPQNPVINSRSFGENPQKVARMTTMMATGMQSENIFACAKHFPGHGDTKSDSHKTLPTVKASRNELDSIHLFTFKTLIDNGIKSVMVAHLFVPALDTFAGRASSLSPAIVNGLLFDSLGFKGLAITDALEMKGVSSYFKPGEVELMALKAGNDILLMPPNIEKAVERITKAIKTGEIDSAYFARKIKKILSAKYDLGLTTTPKTPAKDVMNTLNSPVIKALIHRAYKEAVTVTVNKGNILPLTTDSKVKTAVVSAGASRVNTFSQQVLKYRDASLFSLPKRPSLSQAKALSQKLKDYDIVVINVMGTNNSAYKNYGISQGTVDFVNLVCQNTDVVLNISGNPYAAGRFVEQCEPKAVMVTYQDNDIVREITAESLFGGNAIGGKLPVSIGKYYKEGTGLYIPQTRLGRALPEETGFNSDSLPKIDSIVMEGIESGAYPGARVLIARNGKIFYDKSFGSFTYKNKQAVTDSTIYDLASITKTFATTNAVMKLYAEGKIDIDKRLGDYLDFLKGTNKEDILIRDVLAHQARLTPWIPFYVAVTNDGKPDTAIFKKHPCEGYSVKVTDNLYILDSYRDTILKEIAESKLLKRKRYRYSDIGMYLMREIVEKETGTTFDKYCDSVFYKPLNMRHTVFNPLEHFPKTMIAPTEDDGYFRNCLIQGYVHDQGAAMLGGISGHAGLFGTAEDMAVMCQMWLQQGNYGGRQYIDTAVLEDFTRQQFPLNDNRRGLGFDKPLPLHEDGGPTCPEVSPESFGHSGFTGTYFWVDPEYGIVYIFLSNRVYPDAENRKLITLDIRTRIEKELYNQMGIYY